MGLAMRSTADFRRNGSKLSGPAYFLQSILFRALWTSAIEIDSKLKLFKGGSVTGFNTISPKQNLPNK